MLSTEIVIAAKDSRKHDVNRNIGVASGVEVVLMLAFKPYTSLWYCVHSTVTTMYQYATLTLACIWGHSDKQIIFEISADLK